MKTTFAAFFVLLAVLFPALAHGQPPGAAPTFTSEQVIPLQKHYDLKSLAKMVGKNENISAKEVDIEFTYVFLERLPFTRMRVADDGVSFQATDKYWFMYCAFAPPSLEKLVEARTLHEIMKLLVPEGKPGSEDVRTDLGLPIVIQDLEKLKEPFVRGMRTAYPMDDRLIWIHCIIWYSGSDVPRNMSTPFLGSSITFSASPRFK